MTAQFFVVFVGSNYPRIYISNKNKHFEIVLTHLTETEIRRIVEMSSLQANKKTPQPTNLGPHKLKRFDSRMSGT